MKDWGRDRLEEMYGSSPQSGEDMVREMELLSQAATDYRRKNARLTRERDEARERLAKVVEAALDLVGEYESHGGEDTHRECLEGCGCVLPQKVAALRAAAEGE